MIRRLFKPFLYGTVSANNYFVELLKKYSLYHRVFGFEYKGFVNLVTDTVNAYKFKVLKKKFKKMSSLNDLQCPAPSDFSAFWSVIFEFVEKYFAIYYGPKAATADDKLDKMFNRDANLKQFYIEIVRLLKIDKKFRYKRLNVIMLITHFICTVTAYNKHLNEAVSFEGLFAAKQFYPKSANELHKIAGLAIRKNNDKSLDLNFSENDVLSFCEYVLVILNNGMKERNFDLENEWISIIYKDAKGAKPKAVRLFKQTHWNLLNLEKQIIVKNKRRRMPYTACCVSGLQSSACL